MKHLFKPFLLVILLATGAINTPTVIIAQASVSAEQSAYNAVLRGLRNHNVSLAGSRILVVDSGKGTVCHLLAKEQNTAGNFQSESDRKYILGIDSTAANVNTANDSHKSHSKFKKATLNQAYLNQIKQGQYDIIICLTARPFRSRSLPAAQDFIAQLASKSHMVFLPVANKNEKGLSSADKQRVPANPRDYFAQCPDHVAEHITDVTSPKGDKKRPMYMLMQERFKIEGHVYKTQKCIIEFKAKKQRFVRLGNDVFIKEYLKHPTENRFPYYRNAKQEIDFFKFATRKNMRCIPKLYASEMSRDRIIFATEKVSGQEVEKIYDTLGDHEKKMVIRGILQAMVEFDRYKLTHGDFSVRNMMWDKNKKRVYIIDFDHAEIGKKQSVKLMLPIFESLRSNTFLTREQRENLIKQGTVASSFPAPLDRLVHAINTGKAKTHQKLLDILDSNIKKPKSSKKKSSKSKKSKKTNVSKKQSSKGKKSKHKRK